MSYPYDRTYLEQIQEKRGECDEIKNAFYTLRKKYIKEHKHVNDIIDLSVTEQFTLLGEAFELASYTLESAPDDYHFIWDVKDALLTSKEEREEREERARKWAEERKKIEEDAKKRSEDESNS